MYKRWTKREALLRSILSALVLLTAKLTKLASKMSRDKFTYGCVRRLDAEIEELVRTLGGAIGHLAELVEIAGRGASAAYNEKQAKSEGQP